MTRILCVDDEPALLTLVQRIVEQAGFEFVGARHAAQALQLLEQDDVDLLVCDYQLPGMNGLELIDALRRQGNRTPVIMVTAHGSVDHALLAVRAGADDYLLKPFHAEELAHRIRQAVATIERRRELEEVRHQLAEEAGQRRMVGKSAAVRRVFDTIAAASRVRSTVLIEGESGTGKELVARAIHEQSDRRSRSFIRLNCAALPAGLVESALFGHEKGAFTGAVRRVEGAFERANGGTILLDEISEMPLDLQAKLLRVLQEREFERVGGAASIAVDVRVIATTNRRLGEEVEEGRFRADLFYRLNVLAIHVPALHERPSDVPLPATHFIAAAAAEMGKHIEAISERALNLLQGYQWPGNVRELQHAIERAVVLATTPTLDIDLFEPISLAAGKQVARTDGSWEFAIGLPTLNIAAAEQALIAEALRVAANNRTKAAELLGIGVRTLRKKLNVPGPKGRAE
jgi:DNA-binding NtrC family response regulator